MELNYPQQPNGMYVLNGNDLERIATGVLSEFFPHNLDYPLPLNTDALFDDLGLLVKHTEPDPDPIMGLRHMRCFVCRICLSLIIRKPANL